MDESFQEITDMLSASSREKCRLLASVSRITCADGTLPFAAIAALIGDAYSDPRAVMRVRFGERPEAAGAAPVPAGR